MNLPTLNSLDVAEKKVLVRLDLDISPDETFRLETALPTLKYLADQNSKIIIIGHKGRPNGKVDEELSLKPVSIALEKLLKEKWGTQKIKKIDMHVMENLRFDKGEEENSEDFAKDLAKNADAYVNEAFGSSHREHASIVSLPKFLPSAVGFRFQKEVETLEKLLASPDKPFLVILSGVKKDKLSYLEALKAMANKVLVSGRLPDYMDEDYEDEKVLVSRLTPDKEDITIRSIENFESEIKNAKTILISGPVGKFEEEGHRLGTKRVFEAVAGADAFKVAGGGDTQKAISLLELEDKFDWISVGGGAMLEFLTKKTLPAIEALK